jgi:hypothetical protein
MGKAAPRRGSILIAHPDAGWSGQVRDLLEKLGFEVTLCPEPAWVADLLGGSRRFDLAAVSSEADPSTQARILKAVGRHRHPPRLLLLDELDSATLVVRREGGLPTYRVSGDASSFVRAVVEQLAPPAPPPPGRPRKA